MPFMPKRVSLVLLCAAAGLLASAPIAAAAPTVGTAAQGSTNNPCYQNPSAQNCFNTDPYDTDCYLDAYVANSVPVAYYNPDNGQPTGGSTGYIQNWYSPHCGTNWARYVDTSGAAGTVTIWVYLPGVQPYTRTDLYYSDVFPAWSNQIYAPTTTAGAAAQFTPGPASGEADA